MRQVTHCLVQPGARPAARADRAGSRARRQRPPRPGSRRRGQPRCSRRRRRTRPLRESCCPLRNSMPRPPTSSTAPSCSDHRILEIGAPIAGAVSCERAGARLEEPAARGRLHVGQQLVVRREAVHQLRVDFRLDLRQAAPAPLVERRANQPDDGREDDGRGGEGGQARQDARDQLHAFVARPVVIAHADADAFEVVRRILRNLGVLREEIAKLGIRGEIALAAHQATDRASTPARPPGGASRAAPSAPAGWHWRRRAATASRAPAGARPARSGPRPARSSG